MAVLYFDVKANYQEVERLRNEIDRLENQLRGSKFGQPVEELCTKLTDAKTRLNEIVRQAALAGRTLQSMASSMNVSGSLNGVNKAMNKVARSGAGMSTSLRETHAAMQDLKRSANGASINMGNFIKNFSLASAAVGAFHRAVGLIKGSMDTIVSFEAANSSLAAILGTTPDQLKEMRDSALELGRTTMFTASQVTQLQTELSKLGFTQDFILKMEAPVLQFAQSVGASLPDAASTAGAALRMFQADADETSRYVSAMSAAARSSALDFQSISANLATFGPMAHSMGLEIEDVLALFGTLKNAGVEGSTAMTSLRNIFTKVAQGKIEGMGPVSSLEDFVEGLKTLKGLDPGKGMKMIGPRGGTQFITLANQAEDILKLRDRIVDGEEDMSKMSETMTNNVAGSIKIMQSAWEGFVLSFSQSTGPVKGAIDTVTSGITYLTNAMTDNTGEISMKSIENIATALEFLIGTLAAYKVMQSGLSTLETTRINAYRMQAEELARLKFATDSAIDSDLRKSVATQRITQEQARLIQSLREEVRAEAQALQSKLAAAEADIAAANALRVNATAEEKVLIAKMEKEAIMTRDILLSKKAALANMAEAGAKETNAMATYSLKAAMDALGLSMLANPIFLTAAALAAAVTVLIQVKNRTEEAALANDNYSKTLDETKQKMQTLKSEMEEYIGVMKNETATVNQKYEAYQKLKSMYDSLGEGNELKGVSYADFLDMSSDQRNAMAARMQDRLELQSTENRVKAYQELAHWIAETKGESATKMGTFGVRDKMAEIGERYGIEGLDKEYDSLEKLTYLYDYFNEQTKNWSLDEKSKQTNSALAATNDAMRKLGKTSASVTETYDKYIDKVQTIANDANGEKLSSKSNVSKVVEDLGHDIDEVTKKQSVLRKELAETTDGTRKVQIQEELTANEATLELLGQLRSLYQGGNTDANLDLLLKFRAEVNDDGGVLSGDVAVELSEAYDKAMPSVNDLAAAIKYAREENMSLEDAAKKMGIDYVAEMKSIDQSILTASKTVDTLKKKLEDKNLTREQKAKIAFDISESSKVLSDLEAIRGEIADTFKDPFHINFILNSIQGDTGAKADDLNGAAAGAGVSLADAANTTKRRAEEVRKQAEAEKKRQEEIKKAQEEQNQQAAKDAIARANRIKEAEQKLADLEKRQAEEREKTKVAMERRIADAEIGAMEDGQSKKLAKMKQDHKVELEDIEQQRKDRVKSLESAAKAMFDAEQKLNQEKGGGKTKASSRQWDELSKEEQVSYINKASESTSVTLDNGTITLTGQEEDNYNQLAEKAAARHIKEMRKYYDEQTDALRDYIKEYGTLREQELATEEEYDKRIEEAERGGSYVEADNLRAEKEQKLADMRFETLKNDMDWDEIFNNLEYKSKETLQRIHDDLINMLNVGDISAENAKVITEQLQRVEEQIFAKGNIWSQIFSSGAMSQVMERQRLKGVSESAGKRLTEAESSQTKANANLVGAELAAKATLKASGVNSDNINLLDEKNQAKLMTQFAGTDQESVIAKAFSDIQTKKRLKKAADEEVKAAKSDKQAADENLNNMSSFASSMNMAGMIAQNMESMTHLSESLGLDDTGIGEKMGQIAEVGSNAMGAMQSFMSGDFVGAAAGVVDTFMSIGSIFGATYGNMEKMNKEIERLSDTNMSLISALGDVKEELSKSSMRDASAQYEKAVRLLEAAQKNSAQIMVNESKKWEKGSHSINGMLNGDKSFLALMKKVNADLGTNIKDSVGFLSLSADQLKKLRDEDTDTYTQILALYRKKENSHTGSGIDELIEQYISDYAGELEELKNQTNEKLTGISFDGLFDNFASMLKKMDASGQDFAEAFEGYINDIQIQDIADSYKGRLSEWYTAWAEAQKNGMTETRRQELMAWRKDIVDSALADRDALVEAGIVKDSSAYSQSHSTGVGSMSQETASELNGRFTALQITGQEILTQTNIQTEAITALRGSMMECVGALSASHDTATEIQTLIADSFLELRQLNDTSSMIHRTLQVMQLDLEQVKRNTKEI